MQLFIIVYIIARFSQKVHSGRVVNDSVIGKKRWFLVGGQEKATADAVASDCRKSLFLKQTSNSLSLSPCPLSPGKGDFTGATAPSPSKDACSQPHKATARGGGTNG